MRTTSEEGITGEDLRVVVGGTAAPKIPITNRLGRILIIVLVLLLVAIRTVLAVAGEEVRKGFSILLFIGLTAQHHNLTNHSNVVFVPKISEQE